MQLGSWGGGAVSPSQWDPVAKPQKMLGILHSEQLKTLL